MSLKSLYNKINADSANEQQFLPRSVGYDPQRSYIWLGLQKRQFQKQVQPKYMYYNALMNMKQKLSEQQTPVYNNLFTSPPRKVSSSMHNEPDNHRKTLMPIYHV